MTERVSPLETLDLYEKSKPPRKCGITIPLSAVPGGPSSGGIVTMRALPGGPISGGTVTLRVSPQPEPHTE